MFTPNSQSPSSVWPLGGFPPKVRHLPLKRVFDLVFSLFSLAFCFPFFLVLALAIKTSSKGPILYTHKRIGRGGKVFSIWKFRTMYQDADIALNQLLADDPLMKAEYEQSFKLKADPRVTPLGRWLRRTSLDELPQFWNVFIGDLSVVGPRARTQEELAHCGLGYAQKILTVRPGLTGLWQTSGRSNTTQDERMHLDMKYVETRSFFLDLLLVFKTVPAMLFAKGAY